MPPLNVMSPHPRSLADHGIGAFPIEGVVNGILAQARPAGWTPSGTTRSSYLDIMEPVVRLAASWIANTGALIDPVIHEEWAQTTPRFVSSAAILLHFNRIADLRDIVFRALSYCCSRMAAPDFPKSSAGDFWMREIITAYDCLTDLAPAPLLAEWKNTLAQVVPEQAYVAVDSTHTRLREFHNWAVYSSAGESMRELAGIGGGSDVLWGNCFFNTYMAEQVHRFTAYGMYRDPDDPITYDITTRLQFAAAIARGYNGPLRGLLEEILRRGNQTLLLFLSSDGFVPFGGRSSQFNFQEAIACALCELEAHRYRQSDPRLAGAFKRQAHRCVNAITPWFRDSTPIRHIKNQFKPESRHGCDTYGQYSLYSLLATSYLGLAALYADDTLAEQPTPSEIGGYSLTLQPAFHKVFLCAENTYVEIDTQADPHHDATGIGRILFTGFPPEFPLGMSFASHPKCLFAEGCSAPETPVALGPTWLGADDAPDSLASWSEDVQLETESIQDEHGTGMRIRYRKGETTVNETIRLSMRKVSLDWTVSINGQLVYPLAITLPYLVHDGAEMTKKSKTENGFDLDFRGQRVHYRWPSSVQEQDEKTAYANRHGLYKTHRLVSPSGLCHVEIFANPETVG